MTANSQHTPGPWRAGYSIAGPIATVVDSNENVLCEMVKPAEGLAASDANGRLIAAAPDLLEALKKAEESLAVAASYVNMEQKRMRSNLESIRDAIAKAGGANDRLNG